MTINRFSSREKKLDAALLKARLDRAASYDRIAGYFRSSLLEVAGVKFKIILKKASKKVI